MSFLATFFRGPGVAGSSSSNTHRAQPPHSATGNAKNLQPREREHCFWRAFVPVWSPFYHPCMVVQMPLHPLEGVSRGASWGLDSTGELVPVVLVAVHLKKWVVDKVEEGLVALLFRLDEFHLYPSLATRVGGYNWRSYSRGLTLLVNWEE